MQENRLSFKHFVLQTTLNKLIYFDNFKYILGIHDDIILCSISVNIFAGLGKK